ncbi:MAG: DUF29 family protein [Xenococcaceae cyanobacterium MO_167.B27]|nr:DUF29 family protein [Xenococcaceae cyanobacterium MO_167.B27]
MEKIKAGVGAPALNFAEICAKNQFGWQAAAMTQELLDLKEAIAHYDYQKALEIVNDLEAMSREDKIQKIESYLVVLLVHLLKIQVERRITNSWRASILNALLQIQKTNRMGNKKTPYIKSDEWQSYIEEVLPEVYLSASTEVKVNGREVDDVELEMIVNDDSLISLAQSLLLLTAPQKDSSTLKTAARNQLIEETKEYLE